MIKNSIQLNKVGNIKENSINAENWNKECYHIIALLPSPIWLVPPLPWLFNACSSATKDVVMLSNGTLNSFDTRLNTETETPTAANSTDPTQQISKSIYNNEPTYIKKY